METYYTLLGIPSGARPDEITLAYQQQRERYNLDRVAALGGEFQSVAAERIAALERAYAILSDPQRRRSYDQSIGVAPPAPTPAERRTLSRRELLMTAGAVLAAIVVIAVVAALAGRTAGNDLPPVASINRPAPGFALPALDSSTIQLDSYRGKVVLLNFWWTGCEPCREETPALEASYRKLADQGLVIVGVNVRTNERNGADGDSDVKMFTDRYGVSYPIALDREGETGRDFGVYVLPTTFFIDQNGMIRYATFGPVTTHDVERVFADLQREATRR